MKAIITDLDGVCWSGILSEDDNLTLYNNDIHYDYRKLLKELSQEGVLIGISTKNDKYSVKNILDKPEFKDIYDIGPKISASFEPKVNGISDIITEWNILPSDVLFIDDNLFEIDNVRNTIGLRSIKCIQFDVERWLEIKKLIREFFPKHTPNKEDQLRSDSIKSGVQFKRDMNSITQEEFYKSLNASMEISLYGYESNRLYELTNKTNKWSLNGDRYLPQVWQDLQTTKFSGPNPQLYGISYKDKYGDLGTICTVHLNSFKGIGFVNIFSLSCRAFDRMVEFAVLDCLFGELYTLYFDFKQTEHNDLVKNFLTKVSGGTLEWEAEMVRLHYSTFYQNCPELNIKVNS